MGSEGFILRSIAYFPEDISCFPILQHSITPVSQSKCPWFSLYSIILILPQSGHIHVGPLVIPHLFSFKQGSHIWNPHGQLQQNGSTILQQWHLNSFFWRRRRGLFCFFAESIGYCLCLIILFIENIINLCFQFSCHPA